MAFDEEDLVILEVRLEKYVLGEGVLAYMRPNGLYLPLGELAELLDFPILVDPYAGRANGWFIRESQGFQLAVPQSEVVIEGAAASFDPELVRRDVTEIYVESSLLSSWLGIEFEVILARLELRLHPSVKLPLQLRLLREEQRRSSLSRRRGPDQLPRRTAPYRLASWPSADLALRFGVSGGEADSSYTLFGSADLAGIALETSVSGSADAPLSNLRLLGSRTDIDGGLLGPLGLRAIHFGDISTPSVPLVSRVQQGPGLYASNASLVRPEAFASTSVRGSAPAGWEVELYRNGALLDFLSVDGSGRYEFPQVEIGVGENVLRTVAYGPQGQIRERVERHRVGSNMLRPGELQYRVFAVRPERSLLDRLIPSLERSSRTSRGWDLHGQVEYGIGRQLSAMAGFTHGEVGGSYETFGSFALRASSRGILAEAELARSGSGGSALRFSTQAQLWGVSLLLQQSLFRAYVNNLDTGSSQLSRETVARAEGSLAVPYLPPIAYAIRVERQSFEDPAASDRSLVSLRTASNARGMAFSHQLNLEKPGGVSSSPGRTWSQALISGRIHGFQLRARAQFEWKPDRELKVVSASISRELRRNLRASLSVGHSRGDASETNLTTHVSWLHRKFELGVELGHSSRRGTTAALTIGGSFGREPRSGKLLLQRASLASNGSALARVFLDRNANNVFDDGDDPVPDVMFLGNSAWRSTRTDAEGRAFLPGVPANRPHNVRLDASSLIDPFWVPATPGYAVVGHAGGQVEIDFPIRLSGEIDGMVYVERAGVRRARRNLKLELHNAQGVTVQTLRSSFDGYFLFEGVLPGRYRIRSSTQDPNIEAAELDVEVPADGGVVSGLELILRAAGDAAPADTTSPAPGGEAAGRTRAPGEPSR